jgi:alkylation response protein AidB-like acyl-CoA dehydrogenase
MDFSLDADQQAICDAVTDILDRQAGPARARSVGSSGHDDDLLRVLGDSGYLDLWHDPVAGPLGAALVAQLAARQIARANVAVRTLIAPALLDSPPLRVAVTHRDNPGPVRFGQHADVLLVLDGDHAYAETISDTSPVDSPYGYPYAYVRTSDRRALGDASGERLANWWRVAIAVEIAGALEGAVRHTVGYLAQREQFRRPLGSLQALQHRLAEAHVWAEGTKWLGRRAAFSGAAATDAAAAAAYAAQAAQVIGADMHQLTGAIGFTDEFDLQLWTTRLHALRVELGGATNHQLAVTSAQWG